MREFSNDDNNDLPSEPGTVGAPRFGRLLIVLAFALILIVAITVGSEAYYS
jgi:hypothetical protein